MGASRRDGVGTAAQHLVVAVHAVACVVEQLDLHDALIPLGVDSDAPLEPAEGHEPGCAIDARRAAGSVQAWTTRPMMASPISNPQPLSRRYLSESARYTDRRVR
jgi:hypothetical protein